MEITNSNLYKAIAALRQCAKENEKKPTNTGCIVVSSLCEDVADYLENVLPLMKVVERDLERCKTELDNLGNEKPSAAECIAEKMKQLGKAINQMAVTASDLDGYMVQTPPKPIGYLEHEESKTRIPVFKRIGWFHRCMLRWCFGVKYTKED